MGGREAGAEGGRAGGPYGRYGRGADGEASDNNQINRMLLFSKVAILMLLFYETQLRIFPEKMFWRRYLTSRAHRCVFTGEKLVENGSQMSLQNVNENWENVHFQQNMWISC